jgi:hypothetical protein
MYRAEICVMDDYKLEVKLSVKEHSSQTVYMLPIHCY